jgi:chromosome segregation ATPase
MSLGMKNPGHVNYRDSKLTRILKPSLSGNARMAVICCISPSDKYTDETKSTLQFATRAKLVKTNATSNEAVENESDVVAKLRLENVRAKMEIREKEKQLQEMADKLQQAESCGKRQEADIPSSSVQAVCDDSTSLLELESKLTTANDLVASLERQVDELSSQKNDALDWIEELFSKVELKEKKIKEVLEEKNSVTRQRDDLEDQLMNNTRHLEEASSRIEELQAVNEQASNEIQTMEAEIESFKKRVTSENQTAQKLEDLYSEVAKVKEDYEISQHTLRQVRADNEDLRNDAENQISDLEDTLRLVRANNEELRIDSQEEINELMLKIESLKTLQSSQTSENEKLTNQVADLENTLRRERVDKEELRLDSERQINELVSEIGSLKTQQSSSTRDNDELGMQNVELTKQLRDFEHAAKKDAEEKSTMQQHIDRCEKELSLCEQELTSLKRSLDSTANEGLSERVQLHEKISFLERKNEDITTQMCQVEGVVTKYEGEKRELLSQIEQYEQELSRCEVELSRANLLLKSKSDEAESAAHNVESEMVKERDRVINGLRVELNQSVSSNKDLADQISHLQQDKERLESDRRRITSEMSICQRNAKDLTLKLVGAQRLLDERVSSAEQMESEKVELLASLDSANEKVRNLEAQCEQAEARLHLAEEENVSLKERDSELRGSITRIRELVDSMKRRNNELEGENDALRIRVEALEKDISTAFAERDAACEKRDILSSEMDAALEERESAKMKLNMLAAEFEADYETLRSKVDMLMTEKKGLEDQLAIVEAGKTSVECKSDRILQRDNALVGKHDLLKSEFNKQAKKVVDLQEQVKELSMALKRSHVEKDQLIAEKQTMRDTIKTMRTRLRSPRTGPSPRGQSNNKKASFFRSRQ